MIKIGVGMNQFGMPMFFCYCEEKDRDALGREHKICDKCLKKVCVKLEKFITKKKKRRMSYD